MVIWFTCVIEPSGVVTATAAVDDASIGKPEVEGMLGQSTATVCPDCSSPRNNFAFVLEQQLARLNRPQREYASPVTRGARIASFFWIQGMVRDGNPPAFNASQK
ncbi:hypothetical protein WT60_24695 [Burkholderia sp. MSMB617WGS]|nr:hypothetical protein WT60_24695 [Burkholderia sp. MSMB617WGS]